MFLFTRHSTKAASSCKLNYLCESSNTTPVPAQKLIYGTHIRRRQKREFVKRLYIYDLQTKNVNWIDREAFGQSQRRPAAEQIIARVILSKLVHFAFSSHPHFRTYIYTNK